MHVVLAGMHIKEKPGKASRPCQDLKALPRHFDKRLQPRAKENSRIERAVFMAGNSTTNCFNASRFYAAVVERVLRAVNAFVLSRQ